MVRRGFNFTPLPATRREVEALSRGFGKQATVYLGAEATEGRAKSIAKTRYLHFATHGLLDARSPLDSALALTVPAERRAGEENGLLQAWEIFEQLRIDADLVTLSACETALGDDVAGEGLIGLTRAFHYAGARTVLASLWAVADDFDVGSHDQGLRSPEGWCDEGRGVAAGAARGDRQAGNRSTLSLGRLHAFGRLALRPVADTFVLGLDRRLFVRCGGGRA